MSFVHASNPFIFRVIIDMYDLITISLIVWGLFSVGLFLVLCFLVGEVSLAFAVNSLVVLNYVTFCFFWKAFDFSVKSEQESFWVEYSW